MRIFQLIPIIYAVLHCYFFIELRIAFGRGLWQIPVLIWFALMVFGRAYARRLPSGFWVDLGTWAIMIWFGISIFLLLCLVSSDFLRLALWLAGKIGQFASPFTAKRAVSLALIATALLSAFSLYTARRPVITHITQYTSKLPKGVDRVRIAQLTDIHLSSTMGPRDLARILDTLRPEKPDILVITGDLVDMDMTRRTMDAKLIRDFPTRHGAYAVMGNHEFYRGAANSVNFMERAGLRLLRGEAVQAGPVVLAGVDDPAWGTDAVKALPVLNGLDSSKYIVLLRHRPDLEPGSAGRFDIQLSGHTHGGQIWPGYWFTRLATDYQRGLRLHEGAAGKSAIYANDGAGYWGPPMRFLTRAEVLVLDVVKR